MLDVSIEVRAGDWRTVPGLDRVCEAAIRAALRGAGHDAALEAPSLDCEISLLLADDAELQRLNRDWRGKDAPTNILSFPMYPAEEAARLLQAGQGSFLLGDLALAHETVAREAARDGKPFRHHLTHLLVHGTLHLLGYDHQRAGEAERMEGLEARILVTLGVPDPYAPSPGVAADG